MKRMKRIVTVMMSLILSVLLFTGCGAAEIAQEIMDTSSQSKITLISESSRLDEELEESDLLDEEKSSEESTREIPQEAAIDRDGVYTSKDDVALYLHIYEELPSNFITKREAKKLGWEGGSLEPYAPGCCIGGDVFGNYEGVLPEDVQYHECDIDTLGAKKRGAKRLVFDDEGNIYYTEDHYETFEQLY